MKKLLFTATILFFTSFVLAQTNTIFFEQANEFLQNNVDSDGKVHYARLKKSPGELYYILNNANDLKQIKSSRNEKIAFWINVYNLTLIKNVIENYPLQSVSYIFDFYDKKFLIAGDNLSLNNIEEMVKELTDDQGINFALAKGTVGSPRLLNAAYLPETLDYQLSLQVKSEINKPGFVKLNKVAKTLEVNGIFSKYKSEFVTHYFTEIDFINVFLENKVDSKLQIQYQKMDYALNEKK